MLRICDWTTLRPGTRRRSRLTPLAVALAGTVFLFAPSVRAATIDFNVATGNYDSNLDAGPPNNWIDNSTATPLLVPAPADDAYVRNNGTVAVTANVNVTSLRIGASLIVTNPDTFQSELGGPGILNWTSGDITSPVVAGPILRVGERASHSEAGPVTVTVDLPGTVNQSGGKISLTNTASALVVGASGSTPTPPSVYNLMPGGTIALIIGASGNNGINVRNGTFAMTGGSIIDDPASTGFGQRAMTISSASGASDGSAPNVSTANISGGIWDTRGGIRMAANSNSTAYLYISGTANIKVRSDVNMTNNATNSYAELNMSAGSLKIGDTPTLAEANLIVGDRAVGVMNLSGGTVNISNNLRISNDAAGSGGGAGKGTIMMTGGTMTTRSMDMRVTAPTSAANYAAGTSTFIIDSPTASFTQANTTLTGSATIGNTGISLFEVRQGFASLGGFSASQPTGGNIELAKTATAAATLNLKGGRLVINGNVIRTNVTPGVIAGPLAGLGAAPVVGLTGGILELNPAGTTMNWQTDMTLNGSELLSKLNTRITVSLGDATHPGNFTMNAGSMWDIDLNGHLVDNADRFVVGGTGTGAINGGTLNLNYISGYTPAVNDSIRIVTAAVGGVTLNSGAVNIVAPVSPLGVWTTQIVGTDIRLVFIPEPTSCALAIMGLMMGLIGIRRRS